MKPQHVVLIAALALIGAAIAFMSVTNGGVGTVTTTDTGITHIYSKAKADAEVNLPLTLLEGSGVEHESSHVFDSLNGVIGVQKATIMLDGSAIVVAYASSEVSEASVRAAVAAAGYTAAP